MTLRQKIQSTMTAQGISAYALCKQLEIDQSAFSRYKNTDKIKGEHLTKILTYLNLIKW